MGLVSQEPILFNDTIYANIAYGKQDGEVTQAEIIAAAELANAHNFISSLQQVWTHYISYYDHLSNSSFIVLAKQFYLRSSSFV